MKLKKILSAIKLNIFDKKSTYLNNTICGVNLQTLKGTIRAKVDQDDAWFFYLAKYNEVIFDIGANIGYTAILAMIQNPNREYLLVDPNPRALSMAAENLIINSFGSRANFFTGFVGNTNQEEIKFYTVGSGAAGSMYKSHAETAAALNSFFKVKTVTLDFLQKQIQLKPDLIKIDVEGAEALVLEGGIQLALSNRPKFFVEMHSNAELSMKDNVLKILKWSNKVKYTVWYMKERKILINADEISHRGKCHLLLLPSEMEFPDYLKNIEQNALLPELI